MLLFFKLKYKKDIYLSILIKTLFITSKYWKQRKCPIKQKMLIMESILCNIMQALKL